jgi:hypothetical protein
VAEKDLFPFNNEVAVVRKRHQFPIDYFVKVKRGRNMPQGLDLGD